ncbi:MAG: TonB-dependent receptor [Bacteroidetes bacterium]|nr:MAG: TonB-dependent receptor [Bacteroidota bacterium]
MKKLLLLFISLIFFTNLQAQLTQTVRGTVVDKESKYPLFGVNAIIKMEDGAFLGTVTDIAGNFQLEDVPVGRRTLEITYIGYQEIILDNVIVSSGKEVILNIEMEESTAMLEEVVIYAQRNGEVRNEMATVSARQFSVAETDRYAGSRGDPGRMASNFAGVQGADDSRNDIIVRGNSPSGVLWRLEGVNIPNPNHFAIPGTGGGPVTILNNKFLSNSDFFTGAFPAEFGNGIAGAFDLKMRNGNNQQHEFSGQLGFLGTELMAEGPLSKENKSSYLAMYRYSTLKLFSFLGVQIGTDAVPQYQDGAFRINFPGKNSSNLAVWGIAGQSAVDVLISDQEVPPTDPDLFSDNDRDQHFGSAMGIGGITYTKPFNKNTFFKGSLSSSFQRVTADHDFIFRRVVDGAFVYDSLPPHMSYSYTEIKYSLNAFVNKKISARSTLKFGINADMIDYEYVDSIRHIILTPDGERGLEPFWTYRWNASGNTFLFQPFIHWKYRFNEKFLITAGVTSLWYTFNDNSFSPFEPRLGLSYALPRGQKLSFGYGLHSQNHSGYIYHYSSEAEGDDPLEYNLDMGLTKSHHFVLSYDLPMGSNMRIKAETYYQYLYDIPVEVEKSSFSLVNSGSGFSRFFPNPLVNEGTGRNYGVELTVERFFADSYYFLFTGSVFDSKYRGSDGVLRNTSFNGHFAFNGLFAKEFTFNQNSRLNVGGKVTYAGGRWYGPADVEASNENSEIIYESETLNTMQFDPYFRVDVKINYLWNRPKVTHEFAIDLVNVFNVKNILTLSWAPDHPSGNPIQQKYQLGFLPIFYYKLDF